MKSKSIQDKDWWKRHPEKPREYYLRARDKPGFKEKQAARHKKWVERNPEKVAATLLRAKEKRKADPRIRERETKSQLKCVLKKFGLTENDYRKLKKKGCAICGRLKKLQLDHDHKTGEIRGLLCPKHNVGLGMFGDSVAGLESGILYLKDYKIWDILKAVIKE